MKTKIPENAIKLPQNGEHHYMSVWLTETRLNLYLPNSDFTVTLDHKILPDLVDALIELQNTPIKP